MRCENPIGKPFFELSEVDSSNNYAMRKAQADLAVHGIAWFAHHQNAGKGQRGKQWNAERGQNIMLSTVLKTADILIENQVVLNIAVALACFDFFSSYAGDKTKIKWPNDIYWEDRKAGGILIENIVKGDKWKFAVVGIGININQILFPDHIPNPVSMAQITGKNYDVVVLAKELCNYLEKRWQQLLGHQHDKLFEEYNNRLYKNNELATFRREQEIFSGVINGINERGELIITDSKGTSKTYHTLTWL